MPRMLVATTIPMTMEAFLLPHVAHLRAAGWEVDGMAAGITGSPACVDAFDAVHEASWTRSPLSVSNLAAARQAAGVVRAGRYDIVHVHTPVASFVTRYAMRGMRGPRRPSVVYTAHGFHFSKGRGALGNAVYSALERLAARWTDRLVVINSEDEQAALSMRLLPAGAISLVPGVGIDPSAWDRAAVTPDAVSAAARSVGAAPGQRVVVCIGEFNPGKRHDDVLRAYAAADPEAARLVFLGAGPERAGCEALAAVLGIAERVTFAGQRTDVREVLAGASVLVHASEREGLPRSVMEAMSMGVPVVAARARGTRDLLDEGRGLLVPVGDVEGLARGMRDLLEDPARASALAARARTYVEARLALSHVLAMMDDVYGAVMAEREGAGR